MKTLLVIAGEFPPLKTIGRIRTVKFVEHLRASGWNSIVVTIEPSGREHNFDARLASEIPAGVEVLRAPLVDLEEQIAKGVKRLLGRSGETHLGHSTGNQPIPVAGRRIVQEDGTSLVKRALDVGHSATRSLLKNFVYIPDNYRPWARDALALARHVCSSRKIDAVFTTLPPFSSIFVGHAIRRETGLPWIVDYRDLWFGDVLREWVPTWRKRLELRMERRLLRSADVIVTVSEPKTAYMQHLHQGIKARWETLTNGYDLELYGNRIRTRPFDSGTIEFVYTGRLFKNRRGYAFAEALGRVARRRPELAERVRVRVLGEVDAKIRKRYDTILADHRIGHLYQFAGDVSYEQAMSAQVNCDYLLLIVDTGETSDGVIPGKLFEYVAARRPIFALCDPGATQKIIENSGLGKAVPAESVDACERLLEEWLQQPVPRVLAANDNYLLQFDRKSIAKRLASILDDVAVSR